jgi:hypothetical protein
VTCQTTAGAVVADSSCPAASKPAASRACGEGVCVVGSWVRSNSQSPPLCDFVSFPTLTSHSISFTGAQGAPKYKFVVVSVACCAGFRAHTAQFYPVSVLVHPELSTSVCVDTSALCARSTRGCVFVVGVVFLAVHWLLGHVCVLHWLRRRHLQPQRKLPERDRHPAARCRVCRGWCSTRLCGRV